MDTLIANVAKKKGLRTGVVLAGYDLDRKEPTAVAAGALDPGIESFAVAKASDIAITATSSGAPQTAVTVTQTLSAGWYMIGYSFQATHGAKNQPLYFKTGGTYTDAAFFANSANDNDELHVNRFYAFPKEFAGGELTLSVEVYKPVGTATLDFVDVIINKLG